MCWKTADCSPYAHFFDINWQPVKKELTNKVLLPFLADQYGNVLEKGELRLVFEEGAFFIAITTPGFPLSPATYLQILEASLEACTALPPMPPPCLSF